MSKPVLNLASVSGNAFSLLGVASRKMRQLGYPDERVKALIEKATSGNYDHLIGCLSEEFDLVLASDEYEE